MELNYPQTHPTIFNENEKELKRCRKRRGGASLWLCALGIFAIFGAVLAVTIVVGTSQQRTAVLFPGNFSLNCNITPIYYGELEDTAVNNVTITGYGCNGLPITITNVQGPVTAIPPPSMKKRKDAATSNDVVVAATPVSAVSIIRGKQPIAAAVGRQQHEKDIGVFPTPLMTIEMINYWEPVSKKRYLVPDPSGAYFDTEEETYNSGDNDNQFGMSHITWQSGSYYTYPVNPFTVWTVWNVNSIISDVCTNLTMDTNPFFASSIRFDHEANRFVFVAMYNDYMCIALSDTSNPTGSWSEVIFNNATFLTYDSAFEFSIWGDYYNACWLQNSARQQWCAVIDRVAIVTGMGTPNLVFFPPMAQTFFSLPDTTYPNIPAVSPLHQGLSSRGTLIESTAPCGVFSISNDQLQQLQHVLCNSVDFNLGTVILSTSLMSSTIPWVSGYSAPCNSIIHGGCIPYALYPPWTMEPFANRIRTAYYNYGGTHEKFAYVWQENLGTGLLWGELETVDILGQISITPGIITATNESFYSAATLVYDCRETLFMTFTQSGNSTPVTQCFTYHLRTDPLNDIRNPPQTILQNFYLETPVTSGWAMPSVCADTFAPRERKFMTYNFASQIFMQTTLEDQEFEWTYVATDACGNTANCTQLVHLGTVANCTF